MTAIASLNSNNCDGAVTLLAGDMFAMLIGIEGECFLCRNGSFRVST